MPNFNHCDEGSKYEIAATSKPLWSGHIWQFYMYKILSTKILDLQKVPSYIPTFRLLCLQWLWKWLEADGLPEFAHQVWSQNPRCKSLVPAIHSMPGGILQQVALALDRLLNSKVLKATHDSKIFQEIKSMKQTPWLQFKTFNHHTELPGRSIVWSYLDLLDEN